MDKIFRSFRSLGVAANFLHVSVVLAWVLAVKSGGIGAVLRHDMPNDFHLIWQRFSFVALYCGYQSPDDTLQVVFYK